MPNNGNKDHLFKPGEYGAAQRKGREALHTSGRKKALGILDRVCGKSSVKKELEIALTQYAIGNPIGFYTKIVMPLLPKEATLEMSLRGPKKVMSPLASPAQILDITPTKPRRKRLAERFPHPNDE